MNVILTAVGLLSIYLGYRLFCNISRNVVKTLGGAALAVFGMAVLVGEAKGLTTQNHRRVHRIEHFPAWHNGAAPSSHSRSSLDRIA